MSVYKKCYKCKITKGIDDYYSNAYKKDGLSDECKDCIRVYNKTKDYKAINNKVLFSGNREKAIIRDGEKCVSCQMTRNEHFNKYGRDITVDHIDGNGRNTPLKLRNNSISNLQTLCLSCHGKKDIKRNKNSNKLSYADFLKIKELISSGVKGIEIARQYSVSSALISYIKNNKINYEPKEII